MEVIFPAIQARNLEGRTFHLPQDFEGELNIVLIAFDAWQQSLVDSWGPQLAALSASFAFLGVYELPVISSIYSLARPLIDGGMAANIASRDVREHTLTVYTSVSLVTGPLHIESTRTITVVLVDRTGRVYWRGEGRFDESQAGTLENAVQTYRPSGRPMPG